MPITATDLRETHRRLVEAMAAMPTEQVEYATLDDATLLELTSVVAREKHIAELHLALIAGEVARRSSPAAGSGGLSQRLGHRTPEELITTVAGTSRRDAVSAVRTGRLIEASTSAEGAGSSGPEAQPAWAREPWCGMLVSALLAGTISAAAAEAIREGVGRPSTEVDSAQLSSLVAALVEAAQTLDPDRLRRHARDLRDQIDAEGLRDREAERRARRSLRVFRQNDGMVRLVWELDPESAAVVTELHDRATSPRRGGPTFRPSDAARGRAISDDERTTEQLASDTFLQLLQQGANADTSQLLGRGPAVIRVHVRADELQSGVGIASIEGQIAAVSAHSAHRLACDSATTVVTFDYEGRPLDAGRERRLFSAQQRIALASRDGGCTFGQCDRPPSWCEAHHIDQWKRDQGCTNIDDGVLLCRHHHLLIHNNGWEIKRIGAMRYFLPPATFDPDRTLIPIRSKNLVHQRQFPVSA